MPLNVSSTQCEPKSDYGSVLFRETETKIFFQFYLTKEQYF